MELSKKEKNLIWGELIEIPILLQPTVFVIQPGTTAPKMNYFKLLKDPENGEIYYLFLFHFSTADVARNIPLATHISRVFIKNHGEIDWSCYRTNLFVIGWEKTETKESWKKFIINYLENV